MFLPAFIFLINEIAFNELLLLAEQTTTFLKEDDLVKLTTYGPKFSVREGGNEYKLRI